jgi:hypothetical protein
MAKSNRQRRRDRFKREAKAAQKRAAKQHQRAAAEFVRDVTERFDQIVDPYTPPEQVACLIYEFYIGQPASSGLADRMLADGSSPERLATIAEIMMATGSGDAFEVSDAPGTGDSVDAGEAQAAGDAAGARGAGDAHGAVDAMEAGNSADTGDNASPSVTALTFAASVARSAGDTAEAHRLLDRALAAAGDPDARVDVIEHMRGAGRVADAVDLLEAMLRETPDNGHAAEHYRAAMEDACAHVNDEEPDGACPCGLGASWQECCGPRERGALSRFSDRSGLTALQGAVAAYLAESEYRRAVDDEVAASLSLTEDVDWEPAERAAFADLMSERALITARLTAPGFELILLDEDEHQGDGRDEGDAGERDEHEGDEYDDYEEDGGARTALAAFAVARPVPTELATRAVDWNRHIHYGLWRIDNPRPAPGLWCTDIGSGAKRYVDFPAELIGGMPRWAVWLGGIVPVDGIWRSTGRGVRLSPGEADAAAELVREATTTLVRDITGMPTKKRSRLMTEPMRLGRAEPFGVYADLDDQALPYAALMFSRVTAGLLSRIVREVQTYRSVVTNKERIDPALDLAWAVGQTALPRGAAAAAEGWEKRWLDERVPALRGHTPRQAADRDKDLPLLEGVLRQFEYEADLLAAEGKSSVDTDWLRGELGMDNRPQS